MIPKQIRARAATVIVGNHCGHGRRSGGGVGTGAASHPFSEEST
jgi:hypothetical protein